LTAKQLLDDDDASDFNAERAAARVLAAIMSIPDGGNSPNAVSVIHFNDVEAMVAKMVGLTDEQAARFFQRMLDDADPGQSQSFRTSLKPLRPHGRPSRHPEMREDRFSTVKLSAKRQSTNPAR
jgi:hypothetical protein